MRSVMEHSFSQVPKAEIPRSSFDRSHGLKTTLDSGWLIPIFVDEALPGDTFNLKMNVFARLATPIFPIMDNMHMDFFFFAVPNRLLWVNWEKFCGAQDDPGDSIAFTIPTLNGHTPAVMSLSDYMGLPTKGVGTAAANALPFRAYNMIWADWFRDENLQDSPVLNTADGGSVVADYPLRRRGKRHDYFTSCLPWPQKGTSIDLPLGTRADVVYGGASAVDYNLGAYSVVDAAYNSMSSDMADVGSDGGGAVAALGELYADLTTATAATINQLRQSFQIQKLLERDARGGTRYIEVVKSHFGVTSPDSRLQRPEYLGGGTVPVIINPIAQTSEAGTTAQATLAAIGTASGGNIGFTKSFTEHCTLLGLVSVRADLTYQQGQNRMWNRSTRYDYYWPVLNAIGEQSVLNKEIWWTGTPAIDDAVFGYQERYAEYRFAPSRLSGLFRSDAAGTLDAWHLSQDFATLPVLDDTFIQDNPPVDRVIAVSSEPHFIFDSYFSIRCARPMPLFGVPGLIDHF